MNYSKQTLLATFVVFIIMAFSSFVIHQLIASADYAKMVGVFRPMQSINIGLLNLAYLIGAIGFVQIYLRGREDRPYLAQGVRYALMMAAFAIIPWYLVYYAVMPYQLGVTIKLIICETIALIIAGIVTAFMLRK
jgi:hypothetical protein